jgi:hypothetical protein
MGLFRLDFSGLGYEPVEGSCIHGYEPSCSGVAAQLVASQEGPSSMSERVSKMKVDLSLSLSLRSLFGIRFYWALLYLCGVLINFARPVASIRLYA